MFEVDIFLTRDKMFNTPIGYSKNPLRYDHSVSPHGTSVGPGDLDVGVSMDGVSMDGVSMDGLALDVLYMIFHYLSQSDLFKLLQTNRAMYARVKPMLYENIIIDLNYSEFNTEFGIYKNQLHISNSSKETLNTTFIKSSFSLKKFFANFDSSQRIYRLQCISLPDSITIFDPDTTDLLTKFFNNCSELNDLIWLPEGFDLSFLAHLKKPESLSTLVLNVSLKNYDVLRQFTGLENFQLNPYLNYNNLRLANLNQLKILKLTKFRKTSNVPDPIAKNLLCYNIQDLRNYDLRDVSGILRNDLKNVTKLALSGVLVSELDFSNFQSSLTLNQLTKLELKNISEYKFRSGASLLVLLAPHLENLVHLFLDYRESYEDNVPQFLSKLQKLQKLDLIIRNNDTKQFNEKEYNKSFHPTLKHLSVEIKSETDLRFNSVPIDLKKFDLSFLVNLQSLKINSTNEYDNLRLFQKLPELRYLSLFGLKAGGGPNLGLGMVHPSIFDEWFKVQHVALIYRKNSPKLKYIKINQCLFECAHDEVIPREGIDRWFEDVTAVDSLDYY